VPTTPAAAVTLFRHPAFRALWIATLTSNTGLWIQNTGASWLMTSRTPSPMMVSLENRIDTDLFSKLTAENLTDLSITLVGDRRRLEMYLPRRRLLVEPDVFHAPAIVDAIDHHGQAFDLRVPADPAAIEVD
jgi:hypothetical protein